MSDASLVEGLILYWKATSNKFHKETLLARLKVENPKVYEKLHRSVCKDIENEKN